MKKGFKRFLSGALATVMAVTTLSFGMVSEAFAADYSNNNVTTQSTSKAWDYSDSSVTGTLKVGDTFDGITVDALGEKNSKINSGNLSLQEGTKISIPVPVNSEGTLTIYASANQDQRIATLEGNEIRMTKPSASGTFTSNETEDGDLDLTFSGGEYKPTKFEVTLTSGTFGEVETYTINGKCTGLAASTEFELSNGTNSYKAIVNDDGSSYTISTQTGAFDTTKIYTASLANYAVDYGTANGVKLTVDPSDNTRYTADVTINFIKGELTSVPEGTYTYSEIEKGLPNFDISGITEGLNTGKYRGEIKFILDKAATVTVIGKCGSSDTSKSVTLSLGTYLNENIIGGGAVTEYRAENVPAGTYVLSMISDNTTFQMNSIIITYNGTEPPTGDTEASVIEDKAKLTFEEEDVMDTKFTSDEDKVFNDYFTIHGIAEKSQITKGSKTFDNGAFDYYGEFKTGSNKGTITFTTSGAGTVQIAARSSSKDDTRTVTVEGTKNGVLGTTYVTPLNGADTFNSSAIITLPSADTYTIKCDGATNYFAVTVVVGNGIDTKTGGSIFADTVDSYAIAKVSSADLGSTSLDVKVGNYAFNTNTVFKQVVIDGNVITADELGTDYIYAVKIAEAAGADFDFTTQFNVQ